MKKSLMFTSGALQVALIQSITAAILITFLHQVLVRRSDPELMLTILLRVSFDRDTFDLVQELLQLSLFVPVMLYISLRLVRVVDIEYAYLIVRHQFRRIWFCKTYLTVLLLCFEAALATILILILYIEIFTDRPLAIAWYDFAALVVSLAMGLLFYTMLTALATLYQPVVVLMLMLVISLSAGKILVHLAPAAARFTAVSAIYLNHLFAPGPGSRLVLAGLGFSVKLLVLDFTTVSIIGGLLYGRMRSIDFIGRRP